MGTPKALATLHGKSFLAHLLEAAQHPKIGLVRVVLGSGDEEIRRALNLPGDIVVLNPDWQRGQLSSIQAAVRALTADPIGSEALAEGALKEVALDGILLCPVDHPLVTRALIAALIAAFYSDAKPRIVVPTFRARRGHPVIFARSLFPELLVAPADEGARAVVWAHAAEVAEVPTDEEGVVLNLNDPAALLHAEDKS
jgi:molybdenum cofactor cytidylyltransferase